MGLFKKSTNDLFRLRQLYYENGVENLRLSNEMSKNYQTLIVTIVLAELAFIGVLGFDDHNSILSATSATLLVLALVLFLVGVAIQQIVVQREAKHSLSMASKVDAFVKKHSTATIDQLPDELTQPKDKALMSSNLGNRFIRMGYVLILAASVLVVVIAWRLALK